jgi:uncharacterized membrane protein YjgN (DUF898 family)
MDQNIKQYYIKHGIILGLIQVIFYMVLYIFNKASLASFYTGIVIMLLIIIYPIVVAVRYRKMNNGYITLKEGFGIVFFTSVLRGLLALVFMVILFTMIDPGLAQYIQDKLVTNMSEMLSGFGTPEDKIEESINKINVVEQYSVSGQIQGYLFSIVISAIFAIIVAAIIKREPGIFPSQNTSTLD